MRLGILFFALVLFTRTHAQESKVFVFLNSKPDKEKLSEEKTAELMKRHLANIEKMAKDGKLLVAGPFDGGGGVFIFNTDDTLLTKKWLQSDPAIKARRWDIEIFQVDFDKGGACLVGEPYQMVTYSFLRINYINDIANYKMNKADIEGWDQVVRDDSVLAVARFPQSDGGFIVHKGAAGELQEQFSQDQVSIVLKKLLVAKGAFCE